MFDTHFLVSASSGYSQNNTLRTCELYTAVHLFDSKIKNNIYASSIVQTSLIILNLVTVHKCF